MLALLTMPTILSLLSLLPLLPPLTLITLFTLLSLLKHCVHSSIYAYICCYMFRALCWSGYMALWALEQKNEMVGVDTPYAVITNKAPAMLTNMQYFHFCEKIRHSWPLADLQNPHHSTPWWPAAAPLCAPLPTPLKLVVPCQKQRTTPLFEKIDQSTVPPPRADVT